MISLLLKSLSAKKYWLVNRSEIQDVKRLQNTIQSSHSDADIFHLQASLSWLSSAHTATGHHGVSRGYTLVRNQKFSQRGWQPAYPETTGYIIPTFLRAAEKLKNPDLIKQAEKMGTWEMSITTSEGGTPGGNISKNPAPAVFDTGQVIRGWLALYQKTGQVIYRNAAEKGALWILKNEHGQTGRWINHNASSVDPTATVYNINAIVPIVHLGILVNDERFIRLGKRTADFTLSMQIKNGWFKNCDFDNPDSPLLHTLAYTIEGLWDIGILTEEKKYCKAAQIALEAIISKFSPNGFIPGRFNKDWKGTVKSACLTGTAQIGILCLKAYRTTRNPKFLIAAKQTKDFLKTYQNIADKSMGGGLGALWGSWPIDGEYQPYQALNWAVKYFADLIMEYNELV